MPAEQTKLDLVQDIKRASPATDRTSATLGGVLYSLKRHQRVDAAKTAHRRGRVECPGVLALVEPERAGCRAAASDPQENR